MHVCMHVCIYVYMYICIYVCMYICICVYVYMYICIYVYTYICIYACMYVCMLFWNGLSAHYSALLRHTSKPVHPQQNNDLGNPHIYIYIYIYIFLKLYNRGSWNHTRQYKFLWQRILKSYQFIYILMTRDFEMIPGSIYLMTEGLEIMPGNIHSHDRGSWNRSRQYTFLW